MASSTHLIERQSDWSGGAVPAASPELIPENAVFALRNGLLDDDGAIYRRGGAGYLSNAAFGTRISFLWTGRFDAGVRTLFASPADFGVLDSDGATPLNLGGAGLTYPVATAQVGGYLFIGTGAIYAGSRKTAPYTTGTISTTNGSTTVTGAGTTWNTLVDAGMLLQVGNERVYKVASYTSTTSLELAEPYEGSTGAGKSYTLSPLYEITAADPYPDSLTYAVSQGRLLWAEGRFLRMAPLNTNQSSATLGFPMNHSAWLTSDQWELDEEIVGIAEVGVNTLVFTRAGTYVLTGVGFDIVDAAGNPQQRLTKLSEHVLLEGVGFAYWQQGLIVPFTDGIYLVDGISEPVRLSDNIRSDYQAYVSTGYRAGQAAVFDSHYWLPIISSTGGYRRVYSVQLDRRAFDRRRRLTFPWSWHDGAGAEVCAFAAALDDDRAPRLLGAQTATTARVLDCTPFLNPDSNHASDPDGTAHPCEIVTRDYATGNGTDNRVKKLRTRYELFGTGTLAIAWGDGSYSSGAPRWDEVNWNEFNWGEDGSTFTNLECDGPASDGRDTHVCRVGKRLRYVRFRLRTTGPCEAFTLRELEVHVFPSRAVRR